MRAFVDCFTHAGGRKQARPADLKRNILSVLIANATNLGLSRMAEACGIPYDVLRWTQEWYVRAETLREANMVNRSSSTTTGGRRQEHDRAGHDRPRRPGAVILHARVRPALHLRHQDIAPKPARRISCWTTF
ncbi:Tn3 family transposase [Nonomuraea sp. ATR24]|uniref:Tn3 family transposase n=1 Tax=Nonomuraea TaxID=83681 RepID=UPI001C5FAE11|nr:Tn3 family transposase [Nonomuraea ceibae]